MEAVAILIQLFINGLIGAAIYGLVAGGLSFVYATTRIFHLAQGAVITLAGYVFWWT